MSLMRMNHDQWPPVDPPGVEMDPPVWAIVGLVTVLAIPLLVAGLLSGASEALKTRWR